MNDKITYTRYNDYYIPDLKVPKTNYNIGKYGRLHKEFLKHTYPCRYSAMLINGTLLEYIAEVDNNAKNGVKRLVKAMAVKQGITEQLKVKNQMLWVGLMNNIRNQAEEFVLKNIVYETECVE